MKMKYNFNLSWLNNGLVTNTITTVTAINLILAAAALFKDIFLASYLGTSMQADVFLLAYFIPDMVGNSLLVNALAISCVPLFSKLYVSGKPYLLRETITGVMAYCLSFSVILTIVFFLSRDVIIGMLGAGLEEGAKGLSVQLYSIIIPSLAIFPAISIGTAVLQVYGKFNAPAMAPVLFNLVFLAAIIYVYLLSVPLQAGVFLLALIIPVGVAAMAVLIWLSIGKYRINIFVRPDFARLLSPVREVRDIFKVFFPYLGILMTFQAIQMVERYLASGLEVGSISGLNYAYRMAQFPLWVFVAAVSAVVFPSMSKDTSLGQTDNLRETFGNALNLVFVITVPLAVCLFVLRVPAVSVLLQRGSFDAGSVHITAGILAGYSLSIIFQGVVIICLRAFLAIGRYGTPLLVTITAAGLNIVLDFFLVEIYGTAGLGYGAAAGALVNSLILLVLLNRELQICLGRRLKVMVRILAANLPVLLVAVVFYQIWHLVSGAGLVIKLGYAFGGAMVVIPVYLYSLRIFKIYGVFQGKPYVTGGAGDVQES